MEPFEILSERPKVYIFVHFGTNGLSGGRIIRGIFFEDIRYYSLMFFFVSNDCNFNSNFSVFFCAG